VFKVRTNRDDKVICVSGYPDKASGAARLRRLSIFSYSVTMRRHIYRTTQYNGDGNNILFQRNNNIYNSNNTVPTAIEFNYGSVEHGRRRSYECQRIM
jgi:hypothetical protein